MPEKLVDAISNMRETKALGITRALLDDDEDPLKILDDCSKAMKIVGKRFGEEIYFLPELMLAGEMLKQISELVKPKLKGTSASQHLGKVIIATVQGDIHDIGKDIVVFMLDVNGFDVLDLGIDVPAQKIVDAVKDFHPAVVGLSGFLTLAYDSMKETIEAISEAGLRDSIKIMIGGGQIDEHILKYSDADAFGKNAMEAVALAKEWIR